MDSESLYDAISVNGLAVRLYRRKADWIDPWHRIECRERGITLSQNIMMNLRKITIKNKYLYK